MTETEKQIWIATYAACFAGQSRWPPRLQLAAEAAHVAHEAVEGFRKLGGNVARLNEQAAAAFLAIGP